MPIPLPNLDDRTYAELMAEAQTLIPSLHPGWTNHNPSDPGVTLVELLAWLTEMLLFQVNEIPNVNTEKFLKLLNGPTWTPPANLTLDAAIRQTMHALRARYRAVTPADYEDLALHTWQQMAGNTGKLQRARCVPRRNLTATDSAVRAAPAAAHVSLVVQPVATLGLQPDAAMCADLQTFFADRRTLTTRLHVVGPDYVPITVAADLALHADAPAVAALAAANEALVAFFDPYHGGIAGLGWPFGQSVYVSEIYAVLEQVALINYVENVQVTTAAGADRVLRENGSVVGIYLDDHELVQMKKPGLVAYDVYGKTTRL